MKLFKTSLLSAPKYIASTVFGTLLLRETLFAQTADGNNGIAQANTMVRSYFDTATQLMYAISAIIALIGAVKVYQAHHSNREDVGKHIAMWFGSCIFLVLVSTVIKSFFGL